MREWLLVVTPLAFVVYFLVFPDQLGIAVDWVRSATQIVMATL
jgi:hypothetical protein